MTNEVVSVLADYCKLMFFTIKKWSLILTNVACIMYTFVLYYLAEQDTQSVVREEGRFQDGSVEFKDEVVSDLFFKHVLEVKMPFSKW